MTTRTTTHTPTRTTPAADLTRPRLAASVQVHPPLAPGAPWTVQVRENHYFRVGPDLARLAQALDGHSTPAHLSEHLGPPWTEPVVHEGLASLERAGLLAQPGERERRSRRLRYLPPFTVQVALVRNADPVARRLAHALGPALPWLGRALLALGIAGTVIAVTRAALLWEALTSPLPYATLATVALGLVLTTVVHELAHATVLAWYGGRAGRMGVMLFYLAPAFFCDVSDAWRLPAPHQRVRVALAGVLVQFGVGGAALVASLPAQGTTRTTLLVFGAAAVISAAVNLTPFVKLDGYLALMSGLDRPGLRAQATGAVRDRFVASLTRQSVAARPGWGLVAFGVGCLLTPVVLLARALEGVLGGLVGSGRVGAVLAATLVGFLVWYAGRLGLRVARLVKAAGPRHGRIAVVTLLVAGVSVLGASVPVRHGDLVGYTNAPDGGILLVVGEGSPIAMPAAGQEVELVRAGLLATTHVGTARIGAGPAAVGSAPLEAFLPVTLDGVLLPARTLPLEITGPTPSATAGGAIVNARTEPLGQALTQRFGLTLRSWS